MTATPPRPSDQITEADRTGFAAARWLAANAPERRRTIDERASVAHARFAAGGPDWAFIAALNVLRGCCPDGCCGGVQELEPGAIDAETAAVDAYVRLLMRRGLPA